MHRDLIATLSGYSTYKSRWQLAGLYDIYHPLIAHHTIYEREIYIYTRSDIYANYRNSIIKYKSRNNTIIYTPYGYYIDNSRFNYNYKPGSNTVSYCIYVTQNYQVLLTISLFDTEVCVEISGFYLNDSMSEVSTLIEESYPICDKIYPITSKLRDIFALLDNK